MSEVDSAPFDLSPEGNRDAAALCVHGLTGTPYEVRPLAEALARRGIRARGPLLPGHGTTPEDLVRISSDQWTRVVGSEYRKLCAEHRNVFLVGLSLGGVLCLELAARETVKALAIVGTPLRLALPIPQLVGVAKRFVKMIEKRDGADIQDPAARSRHPSYKQMPLNGVHELVRLQRQVRSRLGQVRAPALIAHGRLDRTADPRDAKRIYRALGSLDKELVYYNSSGHIVTVDRDGEALALRVTDFMLSHCD